MNLKTTLSVTICMQLLVSNQLLAEYTYTDNDLMSQTYAQDHANKQGQYDSESIKYDVGLLRYALKHAYVGRYTIEPEILAEVDHELALIAQTGKAMTGTDLSNSLSKSLAKLPDAHIMLGRIQKPPKKKIVSAKAKINIGTIHDIYIGPQKSKKVVVVKMNEFIHSENKAVGAAYHRFYQKLGKHLLGSHAFILDLRGNHGGDSERSTAILDFIMPSSLATHKDYGVSKWTDISPGSLAVSQSYFSQKESLKRTKDLQHAIQLGKPDLIACVKGYSFYDSCIKGEYYKNLKEIKHNLYAFDHKNLSSANYARSADAYNRAVYVLQDKGTASSAELLIHMLNKSPFVTTIGEYTYGAVHFGDLKFLYLPKTNLALWMPTAIFNWYPNYEDKRGIPPQVHIAKGQDSLAVAIKMIEAFGVESKDFVKKIEKIT